MDGLPSEATVWRKEGAWKLEHELLAVLIETFDAWMRTQLWALTGKKPKGKPLQIKRPDTEEKPKRQSASGEEVAAFFGKL